MAKTGPKLSAAHKNALTELLIEGRSDSQIRAEFARRGYPDISGRTIERHALSEAVIEGRRLALERVKEQGAASLLRRVARIERRLQQLNHRAEGTTPDPVNPEQPTIGPPVYVPGREFRACIESEIHCFRELDRILRPPASRTTVRDKDGKTVGTAEVLQEAPTQAYLSPVSYAAAYNDYCERLIEAHDAQQALLAEAGGTE